MSGTVHNTVNKVIRQDCHFSLSMSSSTGNGYRNKAHRQYTIAAFHIVSAWSWVIINNTYYRQWSSRQLLFHCYRHFVIGHRSLSALPQLLPTLNTNIIIIHNINRFPLVRQVNFSVNSNISMSRWLLVTYSSTLSSYFLFNNNMFLTVILSIHRLHTQKTHIFTVSGSEYFMNKNSRCHQSSWMRTTMFFHITTPPNKYHHCIIVIITQVSVSRLYFNTQQAISSTDKKYQNTTVIMSDRRTIPN